MINSGAISMMKAMGLSMTAADAVLATRQAAEGFTGPQGRLEWVATKMKPIRADFTLDRGSRNVYGPFGLDMK